MKRDNPIPFFLLLLVLVAVSTASSAQQNSDPETQTFEEELREARQRVTYGPHYKNPNAAGRLLTFNRAVPPLPPAPVAVRLTGPTYKNRRPEIDTPLPVETRQRRSERLTGPRYKNRRAKSGNL